MKTRRRRVYIASRMTNETGRTYDIPAIREAIILSARLQELGYAPYCPQLTLFAEAICPLPYESWLGLDFEWIDVCDVLWRRTNESRGADREVEYALASGIDVFLEGSLLDLEDSLGSFIALFPPQVEISDEVSNQTTAQ